jgi:N-acetyl-anhydromuramyl-L-alanine amidase AmpD
MDINTFPGLIARIFPAVDRKPRTNNAWVGIIIHHTAVGHEKPTTEIWKKWTNNIATYLARRDDKYVSAHFIIGHDGEITLLVDPDKDIAYHAGTSSWYHPIIRKVVPGWNAHAIGIELVGDGNQYNFGEFQIQKCAALVKKLIERYPSIDPRCITGHENIAPDRKVDPGKLFPWSQFFELVYSKSI